MGDTPSLAPGIHHGIPEADYHALPYFSASAAKALSQSCPAQYRYDTDNPSERDPTREMEIGSVADILTLDPAAFADSVLVVDGAAWQGKDRQEKRALAYANGMTPILSADLEKCMAMRDALKAQVGDLFEGGHAQVVMVWDDPALKLRCKARIDYVRADGWDIDYKTTKDPSPTAFRRRVSDNGHHIQMAMYQAGREILTGRRPKWLWLVQSTDAPYLACGYEGTEVWRHLGMSAAMRAAEIFRACTESGEWWGYQHQFQPLPDPPSYALFDHEAAEEAHKVIRPKLDKALDQTMRAWQAPNS